MVKSEYLGLFYYHSKDESVLSVGNGNLITGGTQFKSAPSNVQFHIKSLSHELVS